MGGWEKAEADVRLQLLTQQSGSLLPLLRAAGPPLRLGHRSLKAYLQAGE
jgi:hypothetical protein